MRSPGLRSWKSLRPIPHSKPSRTSRASSLKRLSDVIAPFQMIDAIAKEANLGATGDLTAAHAATGDGADPGHTEDLADLGFAGDHFFELGRQHADHRLLDVFEQLVDDLVRADLDVLGLGHLAGLAVRTDVEADERGVGGRREDDVVLGDATDGAVHECQLDLVALERRRRLGDRFERTLHVGLQHDVQRGDFAGLDLAEDVFELDARLDTGIAALALQALTLLASLADGLGGLLVVGGAELVAGVRERSAIRGPAPASTGRLP